MPNLKSKSRKSKKSKSIYSKSSQKDRKYDTIPFRLDFVKNMIEGKNLDKMIYSEGCNTEMFINPYDDSDDEKSKDTSYILNKRVHNFYKIFNKIGGRLMYVKSGTTGHTFKGIIDEDGCETNYGVKIVAYPMREKYGDLHNVNRPENAELMMIRLLSYFVVKKQTPHIVLPISTFNTSIKPFINLVEVGIVDGENKKYAEFIEKYENNEYYSEVSVLISEWANKGDLLDFIRHKYSTEFTPLYWKVFFFQVISVLAVIQSKYPNFRHNDLKANNVLVHKVGKKKPTWKYTVCQSEYLVPNIGYQVKIWDFDFACIPNIVDNTKVETKWTTKINVAPQKNRYYDMHYFFNTLIKKGFFPQFMVDKSIPSEAKEFINRIVPHKYQRGRHVAKRGRILINKEFLTPNDVLKYDPYFEEFRTNKTKYIKPKKKKKNKKKKNIDSPITLDTDSSNDYLKKDNLSEILRELRLEENKQNKRKYSVNSDSSDSYEKR